MQFYGKPNKAAAVFVILLATIATRAEADPAAVWIKNPSNVDVRLSVRNANGDYQGPIGENVLLIPANGEALRRSGRDSSGGGKVGTANYYFDPSPVGTHAEVQVHGGNGYVFVEQHSNRYPGVFISKDVGAPQNPHPGENTYVLAKEPAKRPTTAGWQIFCNVGTCLEKKREVETLAERRRQSVRSHSDEVREKREICSKVGGKGTVYSAEVNGCMSREGIHRTDINLEQEMRDNLNVTERESFSLDPAKMKNEGVAYVWTYVIDANPGNGWTNQLYVGEKRTGELTCPRGTKKPTYAPGSPENDSDSCARVAAD